MFDFRFRLFIVNKSNAITMGPIHSMSNSAITISDNGFYDSKFLTHYSRFSAKNNFQADSYRIQVWFVNEV